MRVGRASLYPMMKIISPTKQSEIHSVYVVTAPCCRFVVVAVVIILRTPAHAPNNLASFYWLAGGEKSF